MKKSLLFSLLLFNFCLTNVFAQIGEKIAAYLVFEKDTIMVGELPYLYMVLRNYTLETIHIPEGQIYYGDRDMTYEVICVNEEGKELQQEYSGGLNIRNGPYISDAIPPIKGISMEKLPISSWVTIDKPGTYKITVSKKYNVYKKNPYGQAENPCNVCDYLDSKDTTEVDYVIGSLVFDPPKRMYYFFYKKATDRLTVLPYDESKMKKIIEKCIATVESDTAPREDKRTCKKQLTKTDNELVVPYFLKKMDDFSKRRAMTVLGKFAYRDDVFEKLKQLANTGYEPYLKHYETIEKAKEVAGYARKNALRTMIPCGEIHEELVPFILSKKDDPYFGVRISVFSTLWYLKAPEVNTIIEQYKNDSEERVRNYVNRIIEREATKNAKNH